jgi:large subunit ribosomal protein L3
MAQKALLGRKIGMSQVFSSTGEVVPVTLISAMPNAVILRRFIKKNGYDAVQLALPKKKLEKDEEQRIFSSQGVKPSLLRRTFAAFREFSLSVAEGTRFLTVEQFAPGDVVDVAGISKGKGFQGVVKRHKFSGGPASHGHRHVLRRPGSIGSRFPQHTRKGKRMAGRMGGERVTTKNLSIVAVDPAQNLLAIKGAVPGRRGAVLEVKSARGRDAQLLA